MKTLTAMFAALGGLLVLVGVDAGGGALDFEPRFSAIPEADAPLVERTDNELIEEYCQRCHNERRLTGNLTLEEYDAENPASDALASLITSHSAFFFGATVSAAPGSIVAAMHRKSTVQCGSVRFTKNRLEPIGSLSEFFVRWGYVEFPRQSWGYVDSP